MSTILLQHLWLPFRNKAATGSVICGIAMFFFTLSAEGDPYGTLFTTAAQRAKLNGQPDTAQTAQSISGQEVDKSSAVAPIRLNGTLLSSEGKKEVWLDGQPQLSGAAPDKNRIRLLRTDRVHIQANNGTVVHAMKPGQVLDPETGQVSEYYQKDENLPETGQVSEYYQEDENI